MDLELFRVIKNSKKFIRRMCVRSLDVKCSVDEKRQCEQNLERGSVLKMCVKVLSRLQWLELRGADVSATRIAGKAARNCREWFAIVICRSAWECLLKLGLGSEVDLGGSCLKRWEGDRESAA
jgi:hypothetical protein